jgi:transposase
MVFWDASGVCLLSKKLEDGQFRWSNIQNGVILLTTGQFSSLMGGLDWRNRTRQRRAQRGLKSTG